MALLGCANVALAQSPFLHTAGRQLLDSTEAPIQLRGTNIGNWLVPEGYMFDFGKVAAPRQIDELFTELVGPDSTAAFWAEYLERYVTAADIAYLAATGANHVRLPFHYKLFTDDAYLGTRDAGFTYLDRVVEWCRAEGLYVLLDMHAAPGGQTGDNIDDSYGYPYLYGSEAAQGEFVAIWTRIAEHYRDEPVIAGYDLANEPIAHYFADEHPELEASLTKLYRRTIAAVRAVDPHHTIWLNGSVWATNFGVFTAPRDSNVVYEFHKYWMPPVRAQIEPYTRFRDSLDVPIYLGESGENTDGWVDSFRVVLDREDIGYAFWPYKKMRPRSCVRTIVQPDSWSVVSAYAKAPRASFAEIREHRPPRAAAQRALRDYLENLPLEETVANRGYIEALGFVVPGG